ncbi:MAG: hypothetical protein V2A73_20725, partial [Pseudomonadota bacterium]
MKLRREIRRRFRSVGDVAEQVEGLRREIEEQSSSAEQAARMYELGLLCEDLVIDRDIALAIYQRAWKLNPQDQRALGRARFVYHEVGRLDMVAKLGLLELKGELDARRRGELAALVGSVLLDGGQRERSIEYLEEASRLQPDSVVIEDALAAARYDRASWQTEVARLSAEAQRAEPVAAARLYLRAARILCFEAPEQDALAAMLDRALAFDPQNEVAGFLLESLLARQGRWEELERSQEARVKAAPVEALPELYRRFALAWLQRFKDPQRAAAMFVRALEAVPASGAAGLRSQVAVLAYLHGVRDAPGQLRQLVDLVANVLAKGAPPTESKESKESDDADDWIDSAIVAGSAAWKELGDPARARQFLELVRLSAFDNPVVIEF